MGNSQANAVTLSAINNDKPPHFDDEFLAKFLVPWCRFLRDDSPATGNALCGLTIQGLEYLSSFSAAIFKSLLRFTYSTNLELPALMKSITCYISAT